MSYDLINLTSQNVKSIMTALCLNNDRITFVSLYLRLHPEQTIREALANYDNTFESLRLDNTDRYTIA